MPKWLFKLVEEAQQQARAHQLGKQQRAKAHQPGKQQQVEVHLQSHQPKQQQVKVHLQNLAVTIVKIV